MQDIHHILKTLITTEIIDYFCRTFGGKSVGVIGSSPSLLGLGLGGDIDDKDVVVRINLHDHRTNTRDFGSRTDIRFLGATLLEKHSEQVRGIDPHTAIISTLKNKQYPPLSDKQVLFYHPRLPDFALDIVSMLLKTADDKFRDSKPPRSGVVFLSLLLKYGAPKSVVLYGFSTTASEALHTVDPVSLAKARYDHSLLAKNHCHPAKEVYCLNLLRSAQLIQMATDSSPSITPKQLIYNFAIKIPAPTAQIQEIVGDYHFAVGLANALRRLGHTARLDAYEDWQRNRRENDIDIVIRGQYAYSRSSSNPCLYWFISNPDKVTWDELTNADHVFIASQKLLGKARKILGAEKVSLLLQAFDVDRIPVPEAELARTGDVVFVGMRRPFSRPVVQYAVERGIAIDLYGPGWQGSAAEALVKGGHVDNVNLGKLYSSYKAVLNDHTPPMRNNGFLSNRVFDGLASGAAVICDSIENVPEDIAEWVYFFSDSQSYVDAIQNALAEGSDKRRQRYEFARTMRGNHSFDARAKEILSVISRLDLAVSRERPHSIQTKASSPMNIDPLLPVKGVYINLDDSVARNERCNHQVAAAGLSDQYVRFSAINGKAVLDAHTGFTLSPGKLGCWLSHMKVIEEHIHAPHHLHILEDDFTFTEGFQILLNNIDIIEGKIGDWDIIFTDVDVADMRSVSSMRQLIRDVDGLFKANKVRFENAGKIYAAGNSSYVIHKDKKEKVLSIMQQGFKEGKLPKDIYLREQIRKGKIKAFVTLPFLTSVSETFNDSTIIGTIRETNPSIMFATLFRQSLAWGADTKSLLEDFQSHMGQMQPLSDRSMIYSQLVAHFVSDDYKPY